MKSQGISASVLQCNAKQNLNLDFEENFFGILVIHIFFVTIEWQYRK